MQLARYWRLPCAVLAAALWVGAVTTGGAAAQQPDDHPSAAERDAHDENEYEEYADSGPNPLAVDPDLAIWTAIVFVVLFLVLSKFAWPQISAALLLREKNIADTIAAADAKHQEAKKLLEQYELKLAAAAGEVRELLEEARRDAEHTKGRIVAEARKAADEEKDRAVREIDRAKDGALHDLAITSANLAIDLGRQVVREQLEISPEHQDRIVRDALSKLAAAAPGRN
jgi:F-type H+-transporting ATPase subunit b